MGPTYHYRGFYCFYIGFEIPKEIPEAENYTKELKEDIEKSLKANHPDWKFSSIKIQGYRSDSDVLTFSAQIEIGKNGANSNGDLSKEAFIKSLDEKYQLALNKVKYRTYIGYRRYYEASSDHKEWYSGYEYKQTKKLIDVSAPGFNHF